MTILHWFYVPIDDVAIHQEFLMLTLTQKSLTEKQNHAWLVICGLDTKGTAVELCDGCQVA